MLREYRRQLQLSVDYEIGLVAPMYFTNVYYLLGEPVAQSEEAFRRLKQIGLRPVHVRSEWYHKLLSYNCGDIDDGKLLEAAGPSRFNQCEAYFFYGLKELSQGHRAAAEVAFRECVKTRIWHWGDYSWSRAFLARMADPNWPKRMPKVKTDKKNTGNENANENWEAIGEPTRLDLGTKDTSK